MKILAYHHATLFARDLDQSVRFFRDTLGMTLMPHKEFTKENVRFFQAANGSQIHVLQDDVTNERLHVADGRSTILTRCTAALSAPAAG